MANKKIFLAPDIFVAFVDRADPKHLHAGAFFRYFAQENYILYTNETTIGNVYQSISQSISPAIGKDFLKAMNMTTINLLYTEESDVKLVYKTLINHQATELTFNEALIAAMASRRNIATICTFAYLHPLFGLTPFYLPI